MFLGRLDQAYFPTLPPLTCLTPYPLRIFVYLRIVPFPRIRCLTPLTCLTILVHQNHAFSQKGHSLHTIRKKGQQYLSAFLVASMIIYFPGIRRLSNKKNSYNFQAIVAVTSAIQKNEFDNLRGLLTTRERERLFTEIETEWKDLHRNNIGKDK